MSFFGEVVIVLDKISIDTTPSECNDMINHKKCNGNEMKASDNKYVFDHEPRALKYWMSTVMKCQIYSIMWPLECAAFMQVIAALKDQRTLALNPWGGFGTMAEKNIMRSTQFKRLAQLAYDIQTRFMGNRPYVNLKSCVIWKPSHLW
ncbi:Uncharacterized protein APZ42_033863 [Daphnia magna]|uniref:Uncharacterized protein n=1 Tax=Daphnia magna TaxID=35525 RepID=A0A0P5KSA4_9CRUS|nr:Uncharacterized protein APZ42_033863 [Daphnia magna]